MAAGAKDPGRATIRTLACVLATGLLACGGLGPGWDPGARGPERCRLATAKPLDERVALDFAEGSDLVLAIDVSSSTRLSMPVHGDGRDLDARMRVDADLTRLAAEVDLACGILRGVKGRDVRVGVVAFSGFPEDGDRIRTEDARALLAPTADLPRAAAALGEVFREGAGGGTNYAAALLAALVQMRDPARPRRIVLITDGIPTLPAPPPTETDALDWNTAFAAAQRLEREGVRLDILAVGEVSRSPSFGMVRAVALTGGGTAVGFHDLPE